MGRGGTAWERQRKGRGIDGQRERHSVAFDDGFTEESLTLRYDTARLQYGGVHRSVR
jgi:hypothetical protein